MFSVLPVQGTLAQKGQKKNQSQNKKPAPAGFLSLLEDAGAFSGILPQDGFAQNSPQRQWTKSEREINSLQQRIQQVNRQIMHFVFLAK